MDIQTRKLEFIQEVEPFLVEEFNERIDQSLQDSEEDRVIEGNELLAEISHWK